MAEAGKQGSEFDPIVSLQDQDYIPIIRLGTTSGFRNKRMEKNAFVSALGITPWPEVNPYDNTLFSGIIQDIQDDISLNYQEFNDIFDTQGFIKTTLIRSKPSNNRYVVGSQAAMLTLPAILGDFALRTDVTTAERPNGTIYELSGLDPTIVSNWIAQASAAITDSDSVPEGVNNLYFTQARARAVFSSTITGTNYNPTTGVLSALVGYVLPTQTQLDSYLTGITSSQIESALGYIPYSAENPNEYITFGDLDAFAIGFTFNGYVSGTVGDAIVEGGITEYMGGAFYDKGRKVTYVNRLFEVTANDGISGTPPWTGTIVNAGWKELSASTVYIIDAAPTNASSNLVSSGGVFTAINQAKMDLINGAPGNMNTLGEISSSLGNDPNYAANNTIALALKANIDSPTLTGTPSAPTATLGTNSTQIATTQYVRANAITTGSEAQSKTGLVNLDGGVTSPLFQGQANGDGFRSGIKIQPSANGTPPYTFLHSYNNANGQFSIEKQGANEGIVWNGVAKILGPVSTEKSFTFLGGDSSTPQGINVPSVTLAEVSLNMLAIANNVNGKIPAPTTAGQTLQSSGIGPFNLVWGTPSGGITALSQASDYDNTTPATDGQILQYVLATGKYKPVTFNPGTSYTDEQAQDAVGGILNAGEFTYNDGAPSIVINQIAYSKITGGPSPDFLYPREVWVASNGNDAFGVVGNSKFPFATLSVACAALGVNGGVVHIGIGEFAAPPNAQVASNTWFKGSQMPTYDTYNGVAFTGAPTKLVNGTIIKGKLGIYKNNIRVTDMGVDVGSAYCTANSLPNGSDGLDLSGTNAAPALGIHVENVVSLLKDPNVLFHAIILQGCRQPYVNNVWCVYGVHGFVGKTIGGMFSNIKTWGNVQNGVVIKHNNYASCLITQLKSVQCYSLSGAGGGVCFSNYDDLAGAPGSNGQLQYIQISDIMCFGTSYGIRSDYGINELYDTISIDNVHAISCTGKGVDIRKISFSSISNIITRACGGGGIDIITDSYCTVVNLKAIANTGIGIKLDATTGNTLEAHNLVSAGNTTGSIAFGSARVNVHGMLNVSPSFTGSPVMKSNGNINYYISGGELVPNAASVPATPGAGNVARYVTGGFSAFKDSSGGVVTLKGNAGWALPTGTLRRLTFDPATVSQLEVAQTLAALLTDLYSGNGLLKA